MNKYVLVTVAGRNDPLGRNHDGPVLHIIRHYMPERVVLICSKEIEKTEQENHYNKLAIGMLCERLGIECDIEFINTGIERPDSYDGFTKPFLEICNKVKRDYPEYKILLNISSGTPQMTTVMCLIAISDSVHYIPVQVSSPEGQIKPKEMNIKEEFEQDQDNQAGAENRCTVSALMNFVRPILQFQIESLIQNYDYAGAYQLYQENKGCFSEQVGLLLEHAKHRLNLDAEQAEKLAERIHCKEDLYLVSCKEAEKLVDFFNSMKVKQYRGELNDFALRLEIMTEYLALYILEKDLSIRRQDICDKEDKKSVEIYKCSQQKSEKKMPGITNYLNRQFKPSFRWNSPLNSITVVHFIAFLSDKNRNNRLINIAKDMKRWVKIVGDVRNVAAHTIVSISDKDIEGVYGKPSGDLCKDMQKVLKKVFGNKVKEEAFEIYDRINVKIREALEQ